ncbi:protein-(glutamine-N5) methyltransferase, release factor-specific [Shinella sumterensis]|uniref:peptide chain release factor N(5)-glutamine methyltransferase n=1 Tax=Shinella sumterensis TaxID=1967501 RepID=UPI00106F0744|nr:peptide chain release factor N(5)-glutamine methyltransferase [Shinella sumterensis]MCD1267165.1 peptide chain release factor N(5)-glutamine methyltransferase [Shinella sumterensis]TFE93530.1 protein-(glutamine-N5) methyltransferase, release factor-specific [Shinella sumterensis]
MSTTLAEALAAARRRLEDAGIADAARDARALLDGLLHLSSTAFLVDGDRSLTGEQMTMIEGAIERRAKREPVHRILGRRAFSRLDLMLSPDTLEPRPDTEILVDTLVPHARRFVSDRGACRILDLGTGTGAICLALLDLVPGATGVGADVSSGALETAMRNADMNGLAGRFDVVESDWFAAVTGVFDIIVSNPPYIVHSVVETLDEEVRLHDPILALDGGDDGLDAYRAIAAGAADHLAQDGLVAYEIGYDQKASVTGIMREKGFARIAAVEDLGGNDRVLVFSKPVSL